MAKRKAASERREEAFLKECYKLGMDSENPIVRIAFIRGWNLGRADAKSEAAKLAAEAHYRERMEKGLEEVKDG